jgi:hypothetical protein
MVRGALRNDAVFGPVRQLLDGLDIEFAAYVRTGPVVFTILDAAEELECDEIVVPAPGSGLSHLLSRHVVTVLDGTATIRPAGGGNEIRYRGSLKGCREGQSLQRRRG